MSAYSKDLNIAVVNTAVAIAIYSNIIYKEYYNSFMNNAR